MLQVLFESCVFRKMWLNLTQDVSCWLNSVKSFAKVRVPPGIQRNRWLVFLRGRNTCGENDTNCDPGQSEEFEPPCTIFGAVHRWWYVQIRILGPKKHKRFDSVWFLIPPGESVMWRDNVLVHMTTKPHCHRDRVWTTNSFHHGLVSPLAIFVCF